MASAPSAVVLVSGGLDSATVLAIAAREGFSLHALSFRYGQRHAVELAAAREVCRRAGVAAHVEVALDLGFVGGSALTTDLPVPKHERVEDIGAGIPVTYVPARNTIFLSYALAWAEVLGAADIFLGVNALDYSGYPDCRPEYIAAYERMANLATRAGVEGRRGAADPHPADRPEQTGDRGARPRAGCRLWRDTELLRPDTGWTRLRSLRQLPAASQGLPGEWDRGSGAVCQRVSGRKPETGSGNRVTYTVKEIFYTLQGEGANAGRPAVFCRFAGCNLWSGREADRADATCRFCDTDFVGTDGPGGGRFADAAALAEAVRAAWPANATGRSAAAGGLHRWRAAAPAR